MSAIISVEFMEGTDIRAAVSQAKDAAARLGVSYVCFKFNGVEFSIGRSADVDSVVERYTNIGKARPTQADIDAKYGITAA